MFFVVCAFFTLLKSLFAQTPTLALRGYVNDYANLLSPELKQSLEQKLQDFQPTAEIALVTIPSLGNDTIENYSEKLFSFWGIGDKSKKNGLLFLISANDKKVRLEVGYGLEPYLTDGLAGQTIRDFAIPALKSGNYDEAVLATINQLIFILSSKIPPPQKQPSMLPNIPFELLLFLIPFVSYLFSFLARSKSIWAGGILGLLLGFFLFHIWGAILFSLFGFLLDYILSNNYQYFRSTRQPTSWTPTHGGFWSSSSSSGFWKSSSSGFGGFGGGSSGGGGASSSW